MKTVYALLVLSIILSSFECMGLNKEEDLESSMEEIAEQDAKPMCKRVGAPCLYDDDCCYERCLSNVCEFM